MAADIRIFRYVVPVSAGQPSHSYLVNKMKVLLRERGPTATHLYEGDPMATHV